MNTNSYLDAYIRLERLTESYIKCSFVSLCEGFSNLHCRYNHTYYLISLVSTNSGCTLHAKYAESIKCAKVNYIH